MYRASIFVVAMVAAILSPCIEAQPPRNLALDRPYEWSVDPNYAPTRNPDDRTELTDGRLVGDLAGLSIWTDQAVVGWARPRHPITITLDLGAVESIGGVAVHSAFGSAGVSAPRSIAILVSDDGESFHLVGDLIRLNRNPMPPAYGTYTRYTYRTDALQTRGRFVRFVVLPSGRLFFSDEIEVFAGDHAVGSVAPGPVVTTPQLLDPDRLTQLGAYARIRSDLEMVESMIKSNDALYAESADELARLKSALWANDQLVAYEPGYRAIVPLNDLHRAVFALYSRKLSANAEPLTVWHSPPYQLLDVFALPGRMADRLTVQLMRNERRAEVFNVTNAGAEDETVTFTIDDLPGGQNPDYVHVFEVLHVDTREGKVCGSALLPMQTIDGRYHTQVAAGMTRQIWLAFEPHDVPPGRHTGAVRIDADGLRQDVEIAMHVVPLRFPDRTRLAFSGFDEIVNRGYSITDRNQQAARQFVRNDPLINGVWTTKRHVPLPDAGAFDADGSLIGAIDFSAWDAYVAFWPQMSQYMVSLPYDAGSSFADRPIGTPQFDRAVSQWAAAWAAHNRELGLRPGQVVVLFVDEPRTDEQLIASWNYARAFSQGTRDILTFTDPHIDSIRTEWGLKNVEAYDIVCPHLPALVRADASTQAAYADVPGSGRTLWLYSCSGPARMFDPSYYRFQAWQAYRYGAVGSLFWAFGDGSGITSWNEYVIDQFRESFTPWYIGVDDVHTSKHFEAAREGVMDYEYLRMLEDRVAELNDSSEHQQIVQRARILLRSLPARMIDDTASRFGQLHYAEWNNASIIAEDARREVLTMLVKLAR